MIAYTQFGRIRMSQFLPHQSVEAIDNWEFMDQVWVGEGYGFSEWLRLKSDADVLRSMAIDFSSFPLKSARSAMERIELPLEPGENLAKIEEILGRFKRREGFIQDRESFEFTYDDVNPYDISCTIHEERGLIYVVVMVPSTT
jgi:hypothetical protein